MKYTEKFQDTFQQAVHGVKSLQHASWRTKAWSAVGVLATGKTIYDACTGNFTLGDVFATAMFFTAARFSYVVDKSSKEIDVLKDIKKHIKDHSSDNDDELKLNP